MAKITTLYQTLITRLPYAVKYDPKPIFDAAQEIDERGLICISIPIHVDAPNNGGELITELEKLGLILISKVAWYRDRHIVTSKSKRLTNAWEPIAIFARSKAYLLNRSSASKIKKGFESRDNAFDDENYTCCIGDHWSVRNDRADRRFLPQTVILNCGQLTDLQPDDSVLDPYGNPGVKAACENLGWKYKDGGLASDARNAKKTPSAKSEAND